MAPPFPQLSRADAPCSTRVDYVAVASALTPNPNIQPRLLMPWTYATPLDRPSQTRGATDVCVGGFSSLALPSLLRVPGPNGSRPLKQKTLRCATSPLRGNTGARAEWTRPRVASWNLLPTVIVQDLCLSCAIGLQALIYLYGLGHT